MTRRRKVILAAAVAAVLAGPLVADRVAAAVIEDRVAERLRCAAGLATEPSVSLGGFPALTQLAGGRVDEVRVSAGGVTVAGRTVSRVSAEARSVDLDGADGVAIGAVSVDATIAYGGLLPAGDDAGGFAVTGVGADDAGRLVLQTEVTVRGLSLPAAVYAETALSGGTLTITPAEVELSSVGLRLPASRLPGAAGQPRTVDLPALPGGLGYRSVRATPDGLRVVAGGTDLRVGAAAGSRGRAGDCGGVA